jgi:hypothetical protein
MLSAQKAEPECPRRVKEGAENGAVRIRGFALLLAVGSLACAAATSVAAEAQDPAGCDSARAWTYLAAAKREGAQQRYPEAAAWYVAATRATNACRTPSDAIMRANSLFGAGTAFALSGDALRGLTLLHAAQAQVDALIKTGDRDAAPKAQAILDLVRDVISEINTIAKGSM